jgi:glycine C-acetyltransferase
MENSDPFSEYCKYVVEAGPFDGFKAIEHVIHGKQASTVVADNMQTVHNFCSNNYSGLASDPRIVQAAEDTLKTHGYGLSSAPLMCGFQNIHKTLEKKIAEFHGTEDAILYPSGYHTNLGVFQACFTSEDAIFSDQENHASIIDGIRLSRAKKFVYRHLDLEHLEEQLKSAQDYRFRCIVTEGIFSMEADILELDKYVALAKKYDAIIYLDECHSAGVIGKTGKGCIEYYNVDVNDIHLISSTLGKAIGGGGGGYTTGRKAIIDFLRQTSRTFIFSNSLCSPIIGASIKAFDIFKEKGEEMVTKLRENGQRFRNGMKKNGFYVYGSDDCPICPVLLYEAYYSRHFEQLLMNKGYYTIGLAYPVVALGTARTRIIITLSHTNEQIDGLIQAFKECAEECNFFEEEKKMIAGTSIHSKRAIEPIALKPKL